MKVVLTNLSNSTYEQSRHRLNESARQYGIDTLFSFDFNDIKGSAFYKKYQHILDQPTGMGYWLWKPYIIQQVLHTLNPGDVLIYADCGLSIIADLQPLIRISINQAPVLLFANGNFTNAAWTKRDCFIRMNCDSERYWSAQHVDAAFCLFRKSDEADRFVEDWLRFCCDDQILTDRSNIEGLPDLPSFVEHRRDQSVLSLLAALNEIELYRMPSQFGNHYKMPSFRIKGELNYINQLSRKQQWRYARQPFMNSPYFQLLDHHRSAGAGQIPRAKPLGTRLRQMYDQFIRSVQKVIPA